MDLVDELPAVALLSNVNDDHTDDVHFGPRQIVQGGEK